MVEGDGEDRVLRVLVTNDDGIDSPGIAALAAAASAAGHEVTVVAPAQQWSGASAAVVLDTEAEEVPAERRELPSGPGVAVGAAPAMCVLLGLRERFGPRPDVVLSGINLGANTGRAILHSGTVGAALTAAVRGVRAIAVSLDVRDAAAEAHWGAAAATAIQLLPRLLQQPPGVVLNLNVPDGEGPFAPVEAPLDAAGVVRTTAVQDRASEPVGSGADRGSDLDLLRSGCATVTAVVPPAEVPLRR